MSNELTYMDCWYFVAPRLPVNNDYAKEVYCMIYQALKEADKKRLAEKRKKRRELDAKE